MRRRREPWPEGVKDILLCVCDHFEPLHHADKPEALRRMGLWKNEFPKNIAPFRDADGVRPRHTYFYPIEQYDRDILDEGRPEGEKRKVKLQLENAEWFGFASYARSGHKQGHDKFILGAEFDDAVNHGSLPSTAVVALTFRPVHAGLKPGATVRYAAKGTW